MEGAEDEFGELLAAAGGVLEAGGRLGGFRRTEDVAAGQVAVPAAEAFEALLLLLEFGEGELLDPDLLGDLFVELRAVREELDPLGPAGIVVQRAQPVGIAVRAARGLEGRDLTRGPL